MFKSNAVRSCVELHEIALNRFYETWRRFLASGTPLPETDDPSYQSADHLGGHVFRAARGYRTWIGECVKRPVTGLDADTDPVSIAHKGRSFIDAVLEAWRRERALRFIGGDRASPFLLILSHKALHPNIVQQADGSTVWIGEGGFIPAERHKNLYAGVPMPRRAHYGVPAPRR